MDTKPTCMRGVRRRQLLRQISQARHDLLAAADRQPTFAARMPYYAADDDLEKAYRSIRRIR